MAKSMTYGLLALLTMGSVACSQAAEDPSDPAGLYQGVPTYSGSTGEQGGEYDPGVCRSELMNGFADGTRLFVAIDHSLAMADGGDIGNGWEPVLTGLSDFLAMPAYRGVSATLRTFPTTEISGPAACEMQYYAEARGDVFRGDSADRFAALRREEPSQDVVPSRVALEATLAEAERFALAHPSATAHVLLATAALPTGCGETARDLADMVELVTRAPDNVQVHVLTVGHLEGYDAVARAGRTSHAVELPTRDRDAIRATVLEALGNVPSAGDACSFSVPDGRRDWGGLDRRAIRVSTLSPQLHERFLPYSPTCGNADGWRYDDAAKPSRVVLCASACGSVTTAGQKLSVELLCQDRSPAGL